MGTTAEGLANKGGGDSKSPGKEKGTADCRGKGNTDKDKDLQKRIGLSILGVVEPCAVMAVEQVEDWEVIEMAVDSGAGETVIGEEMLNSVDIVEGEAHKKGVLYEVADGTLLPNKGEKRFGVVCEDGVKKKGGTSMWGKQSLSLIHI